MELPALSGKAEEKAPLLGIQSAPRDRSIASDGALSMWEDMENVSEPISGYEAVSRL